MVSLCPGFHEFYIHKPPSSFLTIGREPLPCSVIPISCRTEKPKVTAALIGAHETKNFTTATSVPALATRRKMIEIIEKY
jgi:hypothetical protein